MKQSHTYEPGYALSKEVRAFRKRHLLRWCKVVPWNGPPAQRRQLEDWFGIEFDKWTGLAEMLQQREAHQIETIKRDLEEQRKAG